MATNIQQLLALGLNSLDISDKDKQIMMFRHGLPLNLTRHTLEETGKVFKVSRQRVQQIEKKVLSQLKPNKI